MKDPLKEHRSLWGRGHVSSLSWTSPWFLGYINISRHWIVHFKGMVFIANQLHFYKTVKIQFKDIQRKHKV